MTADADVLFALDGLISRYRAELQGHPQRPQLLHGLAKPTAELAQEFCEWRLGRGKFPGERIRGKGPDPTSLEDLLACLRKIRRSVEKWNKSNGQRGYLDFVEQFIN